MKLAKMKVVEMRKELEARGLNSSGTRPTLMKRLREALNREEEKKALEKTTGERPEGDQSRQSGKDEKQSKKEDVKTSSQRPSIATSPKGETDQGDHEDASPKEEEVPAASEEQTPTATQRAAPAQETDKPMTSGSIDQSSELSLDERMKKRLERFGAVKNAPDITDDAIQRRRKRFGAVERAQEEKPAKRRRPSEEVDEQALKEYEEAKKRRAIKFGISSDTMKEPAPAASSAVSADEMEKRLRRQRRFQQVGY